MLPRLLDLEKPSTFPTREALFTHVTGDQRPAGREEGKIWACIHPDGAWIWIIPFSNGKTSVGVVARRNFSRAYPGEPEAQLRAILMSDPNAGRAFGGKCNLFSRRNASAVMRARSNNFWGPHFALAGNATEFLDPIFSSGVTLALASANRAAKILSAPVARRDRGLAGRYADHVMQGINTFRAYVSAWYDGTLQDIFFAAKSNPDIMRQICSVLAGYVWDKSNPYVAQPDARPAVARENCARQGCQGYQQRMTCARFAAAKPSRFRLMNYFTPTLNPPTKQKPRRNASLSRRWYFRPAASCATRAFWNWCKKAAPRE